MGNLVFNGLSSLIEEKGYSETLFGRRRYLSEIDTSGRDAGYANRSLMNAPLQGTAAEVIKKAMINLHRRLEEYADGARMVLQVHDELVFEVPLSQHGHTDRSPEERLEALLVRFHFRRFCGIVSA